MRLLRWTLFVAGATLVAAYLWRNRPKEASVSLTFSPSEPRVPDDVEPEEPKTPRTDPEVDDVKTPKGDFHTSVVGYDDEYTDTDTGIETGVIEVNTDDSAVPSTEDVDAQFDRDYARDLRLISEYLKTDAVFESAMAAALNTPDWKNIPESKAFESMVRRILRSIIPEPNLR